MKTPTKVSSLVLEARCSDISQWKWNKLMAGATRANVRTINKLVKEHLPELYSDLALHLCNPYHYYKTKTHLILVHSAIEYFLEYDNNI